MEYEIIYSSRRTLALTIKDGKIIVRSPFGVDRNTIEKELYSHKDWIISHLQKQKTRSEKFDDLDEGRIKELKKQARAILTAKTEYYSKIMGLKYSRISITSAKTRFGSCNSKGNISYSWRLLFYPESAYDYVVVHELAHLVEMNHSTRFYAIIEKILPDYRERRKLLK